MQIRLPNLKKEQKIWVLSFFIPLFLGILWGGVIHGFEPFGRNTMLETDVQGQYIPFLAYLKTVLNGENNLIYTLQKGIGGEMFGLAAYYLLSPYNLVVAFFSKEHLSYAVELIVLLKIASCGFTMNYFVTKNTGCSYYSLVFSTSYAYMAYNVIYYYNIMWFDGVILLPLVIWGLCRLIGTGKHSILYILCLAGSIITDFYIGWMICIFCGIYFIYSQIKEKIKVTMRLKQCAIFIVDSFIAAGISAAVLLPTYYVLMDSSKKITGIIKNFSFKHSFWEPFGQLFFFAEVDKNGGLPNLFCGTLMLVLCIVMLLHKKIAGREKLAFVFVVTMLTLSFCWNFLNLIWHGFRYNISYPYRYAFTASFFLIAIGYQVFWVMKENQYFTAYQWLLPLLAFVQIIEVLAFAYKYLDTGILTVEQYNQANRSLQESIERIEETDDSPYRLEKTFSFYNSYNRFNDALLVGYNGVSQHTSTANSAMLETLKYYGIQEVQNGCLYRRGVTTMADSLLGIRYILNRGTTLEHRYPIYHSGNDIDIYYNPYSLPLGFICSEQIDNLWEPNDEANIFEVQNHLAQAMTGEPVMIYEKIEEHAIAVEQTEGGILYTIPQELLQTDDNLYANIFLKDSDGVQLQVNNQIVEGCLFEEYQTLDLQPYLYENADNEIKIISSSGEEFELVYAYFYTENLNEIQAWRDIILTNPVEVRNEHDSHIVGRFRISDEAKAGNKLIFSIPYHTGWLLSIDGRSIEAENKLHGLLAFDIGDLDNGEYEFVLEYKVEGLTKGVFISIASIAILILIWLWKSMRQRSGR